MSELTKQNKLIDMYNRMVVIHWDGFRGRRTG